MNETTIELVGGLFDGEKFVKKTELKTFIKKKGVWYIMSKAVPKPSETIKYLHCYQINGEYDLRDGVKYSKIPDNDDFNPEPVTENA